MDSVGHAGPRGFFEGGIVRAAHRDPLAQSYAYCRRVARRRAKNFYYSFLLLPARQRNAMCAIYAFMRYCDDLSDEPGASLQPLERCYPNAGTAGSVSRHRTRNVKITAAA